MRTKTKVAKKPTVPGWVFTAGGYLLLSFLLLFHISAYIFKLSDFYGFLPKYTFKPWQELSILTSGPLVLFASLVLSFYSRKLAGALLLLGAALISLGLAFQSGYFLKIYLLKMAVLGLPQITAGILFLKAGKTDKKR